MSSQAVRIRLVSSSKEFLKGLVAAASAFAGLALIFLGLILFGVGYASWPIGLSVAGAIGFGMAIFALSDIREEIRFNRVGGSLHDRCALCGKAVGDASYVPSPAPLTGIMHSGCFTTRARAAKA